MPIASPFDLLILVLMIVFSGLLLFGFAFGKLPVDRTQRQPRQTQLAQSAVLVTCALIWWLVGARSTEVEAFARYVFLGMSLGFLGDILLSDLLRIRNALILGMAAFGVGHIFYILGYRELQILFGLEDARTLVITLVVAGVVSIGTWMGLVYVPEGETALNVGSLVYGLVLGGMAGYALALALQLPAFLPMAVGAVLFLISDIILGNFLFRQNRWYLVGDVIWFTYVIGQALIVFSNATALTLLAEAV